MSEVNQDVTSCVKYMHSVIMGWHNYVPFTQAIESMLDTAATDTNLNIDTEVGLKFWNFFDMLEVVGREGKRLLEEKKD